MKRYVRATIELSNAEIEDKVSHLLDNENIPYDYVEVISDEDDEERVLIAVTYGDWRNDNDRAHRLIVDKFNPDEDNYEDMNVDVTRYGLSAGSDSCVTRHEFIWNRGE